MSSGRWRAAGVAAAVALSASGLGGCTLGPVPVAVAGIDREGTPVVGAIDCSFSTRDFEAIEVETTGEFGREDVWTIVDSDSYATAVPTRPGSPLGQRPAPVPSALDEVELVAVGDGAPTGWDVEIPLARPLPETGTLEVTFETSPFEVEAVLELDLRAEPDTFWAEVDGRPFDAVSSEELAAAIDETCDEAGAFAWGRFWAVVGATAGGIVALWVLVAVVTARQFRRARAAPPST